MNSKMRHPHNKKGPTHVGPGWGQTILRTGPIPTAPGGWGLRNPGPKGPGQRSDCLSQSRRAVAGRKLGRIMISANDLVTLHFLPGRGPRTIRRAIITARLSETPLRRQAVGAIMY